MKEDFNPKNYKKINYTPFLFGLGRFLYQEVFYDVENLYLKSGKVVRTIPLLSITSVKDAWSKSNHIPIWKIEWNHNGKYGSVRFPIDEGNARSGFESFYRFMRYYHPDVVKSNY
jgi:hypothetical protein